MCASRLSVGCVLMFVARIYARHSMSMSIYMEHALKAKAI